jgi:transcriptional regulator with XRE-family HTH domain
MAGSKQFGELLRNARCGLSLTLDIVAKRAGTSKGYLSGIESGKVKPPRPAMLRKIARALRLDTEALLIARELEGLVHARKVVGKLDDLILAQYVKAMGRRPSKVA